MRAHNSLTDKEIAVVRLLALGLANKEIAQRLDHSFNTTRAHLRSIFKKLNAASRREAVLAAKLRRATPGASSCH